MTNPVEPTARFSARFSCSCPLLQGDPQFAAALAGRLLGDPALEILNCRETIVNHGM
jgi:hypothetical protein